MRPGQLLFGYRWCRSRCRPWGGGADCTACADQIPPPPLLAPIGCTAMTQFEVVTCILLDSRHMRSPLPLSFLCLCPYGAPSSSHSTFTSICAKLSTHLLVQPGEDPTRLTPARAWQRVIEQCPARAVASRDQKAAMSGKRIARRRRRILGALRVILAPASSPALAQRRSSGGGPAGGAASC